MNIPRLIISTLVVAVFLAVYDIVVHQIVLANLYEATLDSWRSEDEMMSRMWIFYVCYVPVSIGFVTIWALAFPCKSVKCGAIYGFLIGLISVGTLIRITAFTPIPDQVVLPWIVSGLISSVLAGVVVAACYKPKPN